MPGPYLDPEKAKQFQQGLNAGGPSFSEMLNNLKQGITGPSPEEQDALARAEREKEMKKQALIRMMTGPGNGM